VRKHPKDLLPFLWDAVPIEVRDAVPSEARDASLTLGRTKRGEKGLLRGESSSVYPEGAKAPEGTHTILGRYLANARQDRWGVGASLRSAGQMGLLGRTKRGCSAGQMRSKVISTLRVASARQQKMSFSNAEWGRRVKPDYFYTFTFQTLSLRSIIKYTKALLLRGFAEK
jgi:hypothetical protein